MKHPDFSEKQSRNLKMKKSLITAIIILTAACLDGAGLDSYRGTPLLSTKVEENHLPAGYYSLVRSYRNVTQLVISVNSKITLYTDRDNRKDSEIFVSSYSLLDMVHLNAPSMQQHEFDIAVENLIKKGDHCNSATRPFPGGDEFFEKIKKGIRPEKEDGEYFIYIKDNNRPVSLMTINQLWKKITIRNMLDENKVQFSFYSIYIDECYDKNINKIITGYTTAIRNGN